VKPFRIGVEGLVASGDDLSTPDRDEGWNELYPTTHKWLGLMDADYWEGMATPDGPLSRADASALVHYVELQFGYDFK
jgi:hypothetical protein